MKKRLLSLLLCAMCVLAVHSEVVYFLNEGFESGIPATWTQQVMSQNTQNWVAENSDLTYPNGAFAGTGRAAFRNTTGTTMDYVTRLISPVMNLPYGSQYELKFAYASAANAGDVDSLTVYYSTDGAKWQKHTGYGVVQNQWKEVTLDLIGNGATYQIAFEGYDKQGRGVVLDAVRVLKKSDCENVQNFGADVYATSVDLTWQGDFGASFQLIVDTVDHELATLSPDSSYLYKQTVTTTDVTVSGLESLHHYYAYVRSLCDDSESGYTEWQRIEFSTAQGFPLIADFSTSLPAGWENLYGTLSGAFSGDTLPVVNTSTSYYWRWSSNTSVTGHQHVLGSPYYASSKYTPAWLVLPAVDITSVAAGTPIELSFRLAISASTTSASNLSSTFQATTNLHVLVSTDGGLTWSAANDHVFAGTEYLSLVRRIRVDLSDFVGNAASVKIALVGESTTTAYFHIDNVAVREYDPACQDIQTLAVIATDISADATWGAGSLNSVIELSTTASFAQLLDSAVVTTNTYRFNGLTSATTYYARVRQDCEDSEWLVQSFQTGRGLPFAPVFTSTTVPSEWTHLSGTSQEFFADSCSSATSSWSLVSGSVFNPYHFKVNVYGTACKKWIISPAVYLNSETVEHARLTFDVALTKYSSTDAASSVAEDRFWVVVSEDGGLTWNRANATLWSADPADNPNYDYNAIATRGEHVTINLDQYLGKNIKVAFGAESWITGGDNDLHVANIVIEGFDPNCLGLQAFKVSADINDAILRWTIGGSTHEALVQVSTQADFSDTVALAAVSGVDTLLVEGLTANTLYYARAIQNCSGFTLADDAMTLSFRTLCEAVAVPYVMDFEAETASQIPGCWTITRASGSYPIVSSGASYALNGTQYLNFGTTSAQVEATAALPALTSNVNALEMSFWMRSNNKNCTNTLEVGVMTDPLEPSTFVRIASFKTQSTTYEEQVVSFNNYVGNGKHIAFRNAATGTYGFYVDSIHVHALPTCYRVGEVSASAITAMGATLNFGLSNAANYQVVVASASINPDSVATAGAVVVYNETMPLTAGEVVLSNASVFSANTTYYVYVRGVCSETESGAWSKEISFTTECNAYTPEEFGTVNFSNKADLACWKFGFTNPGSSTSSAKAQSATVTKFGNVLQLTKEAVNSSTTTYNDGAYAITPEFNVDSIKRYQITFSAATNNNSAATNVHKLAIAIVTSPSDLSLVEGVAVVNLPYAADSTELKEFSISFENYEGDAAGEYGRYVMFQSFATADSTNYVVIDNVRLEPVSSCKKVNEASVSNVAANTATYSWDNTGAAQYEVLVSTVKTKAVDTLQNVAFRQVVSENPTQLSGLTGNTVYYAYVRPICAAGDTALWSTYTEFRTECEAIASFPWIENFDNRVVGTLAIDCWENEHIAGSGTKMLRVATTTMGDNTTGKLQLEDEQSGNIKRLTLPYMEIPAANAYEFRMDMYRTTYSTIKSNEGFHIYCQSASGIDTLGIVPREIQVSNGYVDAVPTTGWYTYAFTIPVSGGIHILVDGVSEYGAASYADNFVVRALPTCSNPSDLTVSNISFNSAWVKWEGTSALYNVDVLDGTDTVASYHGVTADSVQITGLSASTTYTVCLQGVCAASSSDVVTTTFQTNLGVPYFESLASKPTSWFYSNTKASLVFSGTKMASTTSGWTSQTTSDGPTGMGANMKVNIYGTSCTYWMVTPAIDMSDPSMYGVLLSFDAAWTKYGSKIAPTETSSDDKFMVAISTDGGATWNQNDAFVWANDRSGNMGTVDQIPNSPTKIKIDLSRFVGDTIAIGFYGESTKSGGDNDFHVANVSLTELIAGCDDPTRITIRPVDAHAVALAWVADSAKVSVVRIAEDKDFKTGVVLDTISAGVLVDTIRGLKSATNYFASVRQLCSGDNVTAWVSAASPAQTDCEDITTFPWSADFNNLTAGIPPCWNNAEGTMSASYRWNYYATGRTGACLSCNSYNTAVGQYNYLATPTFHLDQAYELSFWVKYNGGGDLSVFVSTVGDTTKTALLTGINQISDWKEYGVDLSAYVGQDVVLYFKGTSDYGSYNIYLDDVRIDVLPTCKKVRELAVDSVAATSVKVLITPVGSDQYQVVLAKAAINPDTLAQVADSLIAFNATAVDTIVSVSGIAPETDYYVYVRGVCAESNGAWSEAVTFRTLCAAKTVSAQPLIFDFEDCESGTGSTPDCWFINRNGSSYPYIYSSSSSAYNGSKMLYFGGYSGVNKTQYVVLPELTNDISKLQMSFMLKGYTATKENNDSIIIGVMDAPTDYASFVPVRGVQAASSSYEMYEVVLRDYTGNGKYLVIKRVPVRYSSNYYGSYIDSIAISVAPTCQPLANLKAENVARREFDIVITPKYGVGQSHFELVFSTSELNAAALDAAAKVQVDTTVYHFSGLERETIYHVYARANCGAEDGYSVWSHVQVKTRGVEAVSTVGDGSVASYLVYSSYGNSCSQMIYTAEQLVAAGVNQGLIKGVSFDYTGTSSTYNKKQTIYIGMTDETVYTDYTPADFISEADQMLVYGPEERVYQAGWTQYDFEAPFDWDGVSNIVITMVSSQPDGASHSTSSGWTTAGTTGNDYQLIVRYKDGTPVPLSDPSVASSGTRSKVLPNVKFVQDGEVCPTVTTVSAELTGDGTTTAKITWKASDADYAGSYDIVYATSPITNWTGVVPQHDSIEALNFELTGLTPYTDYYAYVRVNCDAENKHEGRSGWSEAAHFHTNSTCRVVTNLVAVATGKTTAMAMWNTTDQDNNFQYVLSTVKMTAAELDTVTPTASALTDTVLQLTGLTSGQKYYLYVANSCGEEGVSPYMVDSILMPDACPAVANLTATVAFNAVSLQWKRGLYGEETEWEAGIVGNPASVQTLSDSTVTFIGLNAETAYTFYVKAVCGEGESSVENTLNVTTPARPSAEVEIGSGSGTTTYYPTALYYNYTTSEQIYTADEIQNSGVINSIAFNYITGTAGARNIVVYMKHVAANEFASTSAWESVTSADVVYSGDWNLNSAGWYTIELATPFDYNGTDNLLVVLDDNTGSYIGSGKYFASYSTSNYACLYKNSDTDNVDPTAPGSSTGTRSLSKSQIRFGFEATGCNKVARLAVKDVTTTSATITWFPGDVETSWAYYNSATELDAAALLALTPDTTTSLSTAISGLTPDVDYYFYIRGLCSATDASDWKMLHYVTVPTCFAPKALVADSITNNSAILTWQSDMADFSGTYTVAYGKKDSMNLDSVSTYTLVENIADTFLVVNSLDAKTAYTFVVKAVCGDNESSRWSAVAGEFKTECDVVSEFPWLEKFNSMTTGTLAADCWSNELVAGTTTTRYSVSTSGKDGNGLYLGYLSSTNKVMLVLPTFEIPEDSMYTFSLDFKRDSYSSSSYAGEGIEVYVSETDTVDNTAIKLAFIPRYYEEAGINVPAEAESGWKNYEFLLPSAGVRNIILKNVSKGGYGMYMDNFRVRMKPQCATPVVNTKVTAGLDTAVVNWTGNGESYIVEYSKSANFAKVDTVLVSDTTVVLSNLASGTTYYVRVTGVLEGSLSDASAAVSFSTRYGLPFYEPFETALTSAWSHYTGDIFSTFTNTKSDYDAWGIYSESAATTAMGMTGTFLGSYATDSYYDYTYDEYVYESDPVTIAVPELVLTAEDGYHVEMDFDLGMFNGFGLSDAVLAGREFDVVISTDGGRSWTSLAKWADNGSMGTYASLPTSGQHMTLDLTSYVGETVKIGFYHTNGTSNGEGETYVGIDNLSIAAVNPNCLGIDSLHISEVGFIGTTVEWQYKGQSTDAVVVLMASDVLNLDNAILVDTVRNDSSYVLPLLAASTEYTVFVEELCGDNETSAWSKASFQTPYGLRYAPEFSTEVLTEWTKASGRVDDVLDGSAQPTSYSGGWTLNTNHSIIPGTADHVKVNIYSTACQYWLISPSLDLTPNAHDGVMLGFDAAWTKFASAEAPTQTSTDDRFVVLACVDDTVWTKVAEWNNAGTGDYVLDSLSNVGTRFNFNVSSLAGEKNVRIAFYGESTVAGGDNDLHVGNVVLDRTDAVNYTADICDGSDYDGSVDGNTFFVAADEYKVGENRFSKVENDTVYILHLTVHAGVIYDYEATVCEGETYADNNFNLGVVSLQTNPEQKLKGRYFTEFGCDSTVVLHLTINPIQRTTETYFICAGSEFEWNGQTITEPGNYTFTTTAITGCDSIATLAVKWGQSTEEYRDTLLHVGETMTLNDGTVIRTAGTYDEVVEKEGVCSHTIHWTVTYEETALEAILDEEGVTKMVIDNHVVIIRNGVIYSVEGTRLN